MTALPTPLVRGKPEQMATRIAFFVAGFGMAAWAPLVPFAKSRAGLDEGTLGLMLLCLGAGSILIMPLAGIWAGRVGCRRILTAGALVMCVTLPLLATLSSTPLLALALFAFGVGVGAVDCSANIQAVIVERESRRTMMSGFHGLFSLGGILGAAGVSLMLSADISPSMASIAVAALMLLAIRQAWSGLLVFGSPSEGLLFARPKGAVLLIGAICFIVFLTEGSMLDWSALLLSEAQGLPASQAGLGYAAFASTMTIGRLTGDWVVSRLGHRLVAIAGTLCAALGLMLSVLQTDWRLALLGYAFVGLGCSNLVPIMYSLIGRQTAVPASLAIPAVTTMGYAGILLGPALIGFLAHSTNLATAFLFVAVSLAGVVLVTPLLRRYGW